MRASRRWGLGLALLVGFVAAAGFPYPLKEAWARHNGAVLPEGGWSHKYYGHPVRLTGIVGKRWEGGREVQNVAALHVLLLFPGDSLVDGAGSAGNDGINGTLHRQWQVGWRTGPGEWMFKEESFEAEYSSIWNSVRIGGRRYSLDDGNLFVVRYSPDASARVVQLPSTLSGSPEFHEVEQRFRTLLRDDPQALSLFPSRNPAPAPRCPPKAPAPAPAPARV